METTKIYVELSDDIREWMADNGLSIEDVLEKEGVNATVESGVIPLENDEAGRTKNIVSIILADAAAVTVTLIAISHCMRSWLNRPIHETWDELEEIRDKEGNVLLDKKGKPIMKTVRKHVLIEPGKSDKKEKISLNAGLKGLIFGISTEEKQVRK